jgi:hypothetical protein
MWEGMTTPFGWALAGDETEEIYYIQLLPREPHKNRRPTGLYKKKGEVLHDHTLK